jgi:protein O-GlcNAc transferase
MKKRLLNVGGGTSALPGKFDQFDITTLDISPEVKPDIVASMCAMGEIGEYDVVWCSHALEHIYPHEVNSALSEFMRVLVPGGHAIIFVPDLEGLKADESPLYIDPTGPVTGLDLMYGHRVAMRDNIYMAHHTGFVALTMTQALFDAGFEKAEVSRQPQFNLLGIGIKANA